MASRLFILRSEAAGIMRCDPRTVDRGIEQGVIPAIRINSAVRIPLQAFCAAVGVDPELALAELTQHDAGGSPPPQVVTSDGGVAA